MDDRRKVFAYFREVREHSSRAVTYLEKLLSTNKGTPIYIAKTSHGRNDGMLAEFEDVLPLNGKDPLSFYLKVSNLLELQLESDSNIIMQRRAHDDKLDVSIDDIMFIGEQEVGDFLALYGFSVAGYRKLMEALSKKKQK